MIKRIAITGADGFLGWHLRVALIALGGWDVIKVVRSNFDDEATLPDLLKQADVVVHLAGMNRGPEAEVAAVNVALAKKLAAALSPEGVSRLVYVSSTQERQGTSYGLAKREAGDLLAARCETLGIPFVRLVVPNVFGEHGRPFYNSVFATFAHQLVSGESPTIIKDAKLPFVHAQSVCDHIVKAVTTNVTGDVDVDVDGAERHVSELLASLQNMTRIYSQEGILPSLTDPFERDLFNSFRSYLYPSRFPFLPGRKADNRGALVEVLKAGSGGQAFYSTTKPGITRGGHFHRRKFERFVVVEGEATIRMRKVGATEKYEFNLSSDNPGFVDIPTLWTHDITNTGDRTLVTLFWANEIFDPEHPDTFAEPL